MKKETLSYVLVDPFDGAVLGIYSVDDENDRVFQKSSAIKDAKKSAKRGVTRAVYACINGAYDEDTKIFPRE